jgi:hypothetical protein
VCALSDESDEEIHPVRLRALTHLNTDDTEPAPDEQHIVSLPPPVEITRGDVGPVRSTPLSSNEIAVNTPTNVTRNSIGVDRYNIFKS